MDCVNASDITLPLAATTNTELHRNIVKMKCEGERKHSSLKTCPVMDNEWLGASAR